MKVLFVISIMALSLSAFADQGQNQGQGQGQAQGQVPAQGPGQGQSAEPTPDYETVIGLGGYAQTPDQLFERGCEAAIFEARVCSITGHFSDGDPCYAVYSDEVEGRWVTPSNRPMVLQFLDGLENQRSSSGSCD